MNERINLNVILVGSNPLPCYIQAAYILGGGEELKKPDKILFVVTKNTDNNENGTRKYAENIVKILKKYDLCDDGLADYLELENGYNSEIIEKQIKEKINKINEKENGIGEIFLNNTGGTKAMAVYATIAIDSLEFRNSITVTECYVDPRINQLRCYKRSGSAREGRMTCIPENGDLRNYVKLDIKDLIYLHYGENTLHYRDLNGRGASGEEEEGYFLREGLTERQFQVAGELLANAGSWKTYSSFWKKCHRSCENAKGEKNKLKNLKKALKALEDSLVDDLKGLFGMEPDRNLREEEELQRVLLPFCSGEWLERYFYKALIQAKENLAKKEIDIHTAWSLEVKPAENTKTFEVDVVAVKGYEMKLFSISMAETGEEGLAKGKWFEAVYRTEQMAGEHGRVAIVNLLEDKKQESSIDEFKKDLASFDRNVELFKREDLQDYEGLVKRLTEEFR